MSVLVSPSHGSASYGGLCVCGSVWACAVCAVKVGERRRAELEHAVSTWRARGGVVLMAVYTVSHGPKAGLKGLADRFLAAQLRMKRTRAYRTFRERWGIVGSVKALEVTCGPVNGWHPHTHELVFMEAPIGDLERFSNELYEMWERAAAREGLTMSRRRGLDVQETAGAIGDYIAKYGHEPDRRPWGPEDELTKANSKRAGRQDAGVRYTPFDLLRSVMETGDSWAADRFREFVDAMFRRKQLTWSPGLRESVGLDDEVSDEELAARPEDDAVELTRLSIGEWAAVRDLELRGELIVLAGRGELDPVREFVEQAVLKWKRGRA